MRRRTETSQVIVELVERFDHIHILCLSVQRCPSTQMRENYNNNKLAQKSTDKQSKYSSIKKLCASTHSLTHDGI